MTLERGQASFNSREITYYMDGDKTITKVENEMKNYKFKSLQFR